MHGKALRQVIKHMKTFNELTHFAGLDWATDHHDVVLVERNGQVLEDFRFAHTAEGWQQWRERIKAYPALGVAIETSVNNSTKNPLYSTENFSPHLSSGFSLPTSSLMAMVSHGSFIGGRSA
jgi:hypothetical protein